VALHGKSLHERVRGAVSELERVAKRMGVSSIHAVEVPTDDVRTRVEKAAKAFVPVIPTSAPKTDAIRR